jgi:hypothetical protein
MVPQQRCVPILLCGELHPELKINRMHGTEKAVQFAHILFNIDEPANDLR